ncbi:MAG: hypothetical protein ACM3ZE_07470 [Myxococcales bacterium]
MIESIGLTSFERQLDAIERQLDAIERQLDAIERQLDAIERATLFRRVGGTNCEHVWGDCRFRRLGTKATALGSGGWGSSL